MGQKLHHPGISLMAKALGLSWEWLKGGLKWKLLFRVGFRACLLRNA